MKVVSEPLVTVLTPVYNMGTFLSECVESVLNQSYRNFEYIIVNNCSTDNTLDVAMSYARRDPRVQVHNNEKFVGVIENHNIAFSRMSPAAKYCKVVSADDFIFPECLARLVECAESNPSAGIIGSYQLNGLDVLWQGFTFPKSLFSGREVCRKIFLGNDKMFGFGTPTSLLYRADIVRNKREFYPDKSPHADTSACFQELVSSDYGFVYQVLSYQRVHANTQSAKSEDMNRYASAYLNDVLRYGPSYLTREEFDAKVKRTLREYFEYLAVNLLRRRGKGFWDYHKSRLKELGFPVTPSKLFSAFVSKAFKKLARPEQALNKIFHYS